MNTNSTQTRTIAAILLGLALTIATGTVYGRLSQRWGPTPDMVAAGEHLQTLPKQFGDWEATEDVPLGDTARDMLQCAGYIGRRYVNRASGDTVTVALLLGPPGPISVHTPEVCFSARAYTPEKRREETVLTDGQSQSHSFWGLTMRPKTVTGDYLRVYYAWTPDNTWTASRRPRYEFAVDPMLYKIQLAGPVLPNELSEGKDPCRDFLEALVSLDWKPNKAQSASE